MSSTAHELAVAWRRCGITLGDVVLVHSRIARTLLTLKRAGKRASAHDILDSFLKAVGPKGTLLLPLFNFGFTKGIPFDIRHTPSHTGALTEAGRLHPEAVRTGHPIYSFAAIGAEAERFRGLVNYSGYGSDSPFGILRELDGKIAVLDLLDLESMTFYHHVEEMLEVPYRYHKAFRSDYTNWQGNTLRREFGLFVRDLDRGVETYTNVMGELLWEHGLYTGCRPLAGCGLRVISAIGLFNATAEVIRSGRAEGLLYRIVKS